MKLTITYILTYSNPPVLKVMYHETPVGGAEAPGGDPPTKIMFHNF